MPYSWRTNIFSYCKMWIQLLEFKRFMQEQCNQHYLSNTFQKMQLPVSLRHEGFGKPQNVLRFYPQKCKQYYSTTELRTIQQLFTQEIVNTTWITWRLLVQINDETQTSPKSSLNAYMTPERYDMTTLIKD